ncbi:aspartate kinase [Flavobacteriaceae bacterium M23B6Z8]
MDILKFGGTSVSSKESLYNILRILSSYNTPNESVIMVVSALKGVTNKLTRITELLTSQDEQYRVLFDEVKSDHSSYIEEILPVNAQILMKNIIGLLESEYDCYLKELFEEGRIYPKDKDRILSFGELCSAQIIKMFLEVNGKDFGFLDSRKLIVTDNNHGNAKVNWVMTRKRIGSFFQAFPGNYLISGFIGATAKGSTTTLGRGGSDYTATVFATVLNAKSVVKYTDVNGIMTADPNKVTDSYSLDKITYGELFCLSKFGSNVLVHEDSIDRLRRERIPLVIRNTFNIDFKGTVVTEGLNAGQRAISHRKSCHLVRFEKDINISKQTLRQIKDHGHLFFRLKNADAKDHNQSFYIVSDACLQYFSELSLSKGNVQACNTTFHNSEILYSDIALVTVASIEKNKKLEQERVSQILHERKIEILGTRLFQNAISIILRSEDARSALNCLHKELTICQKEKVV